jgi:hypothetical protein
MCGGHPRHRPRWNQPRTGHSGPADSRAGTPTLARQCWSSTLVNSLSSASRLAAANAASTHSPPGRSSPNNPMTRRTPSPAPRVLTWGSHSSTCRTVTPPALSGLVGRAGAAGESAHDPPATAGSGLVIRREPMPEVTLDTADATELSDVLHFLPSWLARDPAACAHRWKASPATRLRAYAAA